MTKKLRHENGQETKNLVFLHYFGGAAASWRWVKKQLHEKYNVLAINFPGCGGEPLTQEPSIKNFALFVLKKIKEAGVEHCTLIGHSMGAKIAVEVAALAHNNLIRQLILIAPSPPSTEPISQEEKRRMLRHPNKMEAENTIKNITVQPLTDDQFSLAVETQLETNSKTWNWWLEKGMNHSIAEKAEQLDIPVAILVSEDDPVITPELVEQRVLPVFPKSNQITTKGVGHLSPFEAPEWIASCIYELIQPS